MSEQPETPPINLPLLNNISSEQRRILSNLYRLSRDADMQCALAHAQNYQAALTSGTLPDGQGGVITNPDQPVPALDNLTINQALNIAATMTALCAFMVSPPGEGEPAPAQVALATLQI